MKNTIKHITLYSIRIFLMVFWLYVALDKLWNLSAFHSALIRQPFPDWWADILFLLLPLTELGLAILFIANHPSNSRHSEDPPIGGDVGIWNLSTRLPYILSAAILVIFNIYIALGVAGLYAEQPYASVFSGLSGDWHLLVTLFLLGLSILGWYLTGPTAPMVAYKRSKRQVILFIQYPIRIMVPMYRIILVRIKVFKMRFAPFPGKAGIRINYDTWRYPRQTYCKSIPREQVDASRKIKASIYQSFLEDVFCYYKNGNKT